MQAPDELLARCVRRAARRLECRAVDRDDLVQAAYLQFARTGIPEDLTRAMWVATAAMRRLRRRELYAGRRGRLVRRHERLDDQPGEFSARDYPEPLPETVALMRRLTDFEALVLTLVCGLDGSPGRSFGLVGAIIGRPRQPVWRWYRSAVAKLARGRGPEMPAIRDGDLVTVRTDPRPEVWIVLHVGVAMGLHHQEAHLRLARESWGRPTRIVPLADCVAVPPDLEEFPCSPV